MKLRPNYEKQKFLINSLGLQAMQSVKFSVTLSFVTSHLSRLRHKTFVHHVTAPLHSAYEAVKG